MGGEWGVGEWGSGGFWWFFSESDTGEVVGVKGELGGLPVER